MPAVLEDSVRDRLLQFHVMIHATGDCRLKRMFRRFIQKERERLARLQEERMTAIPPSLPL